MSEAHLDHWRIKRATDDVFVFGPIFLAPKWNAKDAAFVAALAATPKRGMLWSDAEAQGFLEAQVAKEASRVCARINRAWRASVCMRAGRELKNIGALVRSCHAHGKGTPMCIVVHDGLAWMEAFRAAVIAGFSKEEAARLSAITGVRFTMKDLAKPTGWSTYHEERNTIGFKWDDWREDHPMYRAIMAIALLNGDNPYDFGDLKIAFHWGWLQDDKRFAERVAQFLGEKAAVRIGFLKKTTTTWERKHRPEAT